MSTRAPRSTTRLVALFAALLAAVTACAPAPAATPATAPKPAATTAPAAQPAPKPTTAPAKADASAVLDKTFAALPDGFLNIAPKAASEQMAATRTLLIDVREPSEVEKGYIQGAVHIPIRSFGENLDKLPADKAAPIIVYCGSSQRSPMALLTLRSLGYTNARNLQGGTGNWTKEGLPLVTEPAIAKPTAPATPPTLDADLVSAFQKFYSGLPEGYNLVQAPALKEQMAAAKPFLLDVREPSETSKGYIEGATMQPIRGLMQNLSKLPTDKSAPIIVYCGSGHRSAMAMEALKIAGYTNVKSLASGTGAWTAANFPLVGAS